MAGTSRKGSLDVRCFAMACVPALGAESPGRNKTEISEVEHMRHTSNAP